MKVESIGEVIAEREFTLIRDSNESQTLLVTLGKPQRAPNHTDFFCPYEIRNDGTQAVYGLCGIDAFQAMPMALKGIALKAEVIRENSGGRLIGDGGDKGDLGVSAPE